MSAGSKGGVGKSLFSFALVDYLLSRNANALLVDTDTDNPDVFKAHKDLALPNLLCRLNSLDDADGWADLLDTVQNYPDYAVVINAAARTKTSTTSYGDIMKEALREMRRELTVFWIINGIAIPSSFCIPFRKYSRTYPSMSAGTCISVKRGVLICITALKHGKRWRRTA